jgi:uncharacterized protein with NRDE domain
MCIIFVGFNVREDHPLILAANRDEFYNRPTAAAAFWEDAPDIFAGRDLVGGGTWLGVNKRGRFAAVTNYRDPNGRVGSISRGSLVADFLRGDEPAGEYLEGVRSRAEEFSGFNLLAGELTAARQELFYYSNRGGEVSELKPGVYGLSNHLLDTGWPKVSGGKLRFEALLNENELDKESIFRLLSDEALADDSALPDTGVGYEIEKALSAVFIRTPGYGTRCSTLLTFDGDFRYDLDERVFV